MSEITSTYTPERFRERSTEFGSTRRLLTYSELSTFRNCRRHHYWRYERAIAPMCDTAPSLRFGDNFHKLLERWHGGDAASCQDYIETVGPDLISDECGAEQVNTEKARLAAMLQAYATFYPRESEDFEVLALEREFRIEIRNPGTGACSRSFILGGKIDGLLRRSDGLWLLEHKTASESSLNRAYIDRLQLDFQIQIYTMALSRLLKEPVQGVIYNVICKPALRPYQVSQKRKVAETYIEYVQRCREWFDEYRNSSDESMQTRLLRVPLFVDHDRQRLLQEELWELTQQLLFARKRSFWYQNTSNCFAYNRPCPYMPICVSKDNPLLIENQYVARERHTELEPGHEEESSASASIF